MRCRIIVSGLTMLLLSLPLNFTGSLRAAPPDLNAPKTDARIRSLITPYLDAEIVDGLSVGIVSGDKSKTYHFGKTSTNGTTPNDQTVYEIGSVSKVFTGILLADAAIRNEVSLDQPAQELLRDVAKMPKKGDKDITLADLSTHWSGLPRLPSNMRNVGGNNPYSDYTSDLAIEFLNSHELGRAPGQQMEYSNLAVSFLGHLLCRQAGKSYDDLLSERIAGPIGMTSTTVTGNAEVLKRLATGHSTVGKPHSTWEFADMPGAGGIRSSVVDMIKFARANLDPPQDDFGKALDLAWQQHRAGDAQNFAMGLGWHIARDGTTRWHNGQTGGFHSMLMISRDFEAAVVVLSNTATMEIDRLGEDLIRLLAGANVQPRTFEASVKVAEGKMQRCEGKYQLVPGVNFDVNLVKGRLMVQLTGQPAFEVFAKSETEWFYKVVPASLTFKKEVDGEFQELELYQNGIRQTAKRIK